MTGRVVVITGGTRGIGRALARACRERGAHVVVAARGVGEDDGDAIVADVTRADDLARLVAGVRARLGRIDVLVNAAGVTGDDFAHVMATNAGGALAGARAVLAAQPDARIVHISSGIVAAPRAGAAVYAASKHAVEGITRALACEVGEHAVVCCVQLGAHRTDMTARVYAAGEFAALPPAEAAVPALLHAMTAPAADVHGRVIEAWRATERAPDTAGADAFAHPLGASPYAREALASWARDGALERYPAAAAPLVKLLAAEHDVPLDAVVIGAGASELVDRALGVWLRAGDKLVANTPSWPLFPRMCRARGLVAITIPYQLRAARADHDLAAIAAVVARDRGVRVVYVISPSNPMGNAIDDADFARFVAALPARVTVVVDEAYAEFTTRPEALRAPAYARRGAPVIAIRTFSKFYALAGLRIGYAIAPPPIARALVAAAPPFAVSTGAVLAAAAALADREHHARTLGLCARARAALPRDHLATDAPFALAAVPGAPRYFDGRYAMVPLWATDTTRTIT